MDKIVTKSGIWASLLGKILLYNFAPDATLTGHRKQFTYINYKLPTFILVSKTPLDSLLAWGNLRELQDGVVVVFSQTIAA